MRLRWATTALKKSYLGMPCRCFIYIYGLRDEQVLPDLNLMKGRGGALLREKMAEAASENFVVIVDDVKLVTGLGGSGVAMPVEVVQFCWKYNQTRLQELFKEGCEAKLRLDADGKPYVMLLTIQATLWICTSKHRLRMHQLQERIEISTLQGVIEHGLFLDMVSAVIIAGEDGVSIKSK